MLIATPADAILPAAARAQLVAGLRAVDYVSKLAGGIAPQIRLEQEDDERFQLYCGTYTCGRGLRLKSDDMSHSGGSPQFNGRRDSRTARGGEPQAQFSA